MLNASTGASNSLYVQSYIHVMIYNVCIIMYAFIFIYILKHIKHTALLHLTCRFVTMIVLVHVSVLVFLYRHAECLIVV